MTYVSQADLQIGGTAVQCVMTGGEPELLLEQIVSMSLGRPLMGPGHRWQNMVFGYLNLDYGDGALDGFNTNETKEESTICLDHIFQKSVSFWPVTLLSSFTKK